ncbi:MAG: trypsin-like peptidase domain-containing protein [Planctomycetales bacterium]
MKIRRVLSLYFMMGMLLFARPVSGEQPDSLAEIYRKSKLAGVEVLIDGHHAGCGAFVDRGGIVATAAHVIGSPDRKVEIRCSEGRLDATVIAVDMGRDVALLQVPANTKGYAFLSLAEKKPVPGDEALLYASPVYRHGLFQRGMIARDETTFEHQSHFVEVTHISAHVYEGSSGGPWMNRAGELIGIQSGSITVNSTSAGVANVGSVSAVRTLMKTRRNAATPTLGLFVDEVWVLQPKPLRRFPPKTEGVVIQSLVQDGPAARAGLKKGEAVVEADGEKFRLRDEFLRIIRRKKPGESMTLKILRPNGAGVHAVTVSLGRLEVGWPDAKQ